MHHVIRLPECRRLSRSPATPATARCRRGPCATIQAARGDPPCGSARAASATHGNQIRPYPVDAHWTSDVLQILLAHVFKTTIEPSLNLVADDCGNTYAAWCRQPLQPCRNIDAIAVDVAVGDHDVAEIDADAKFHPLVFLDRRVAVGHIALHRDGARDGLDNALKLSEEAVTSILNDPSLALCNFRVNQFTIVGTEPSKCAGFVLPHQAAVAGNVGR